MAYGTDGEVMDFAYGGQKNVTPGIVPTARKTATSLINQYLNLVKDADPTPPVLDNVANYIAAEIVKNPRTPLRELLESIDILLGVTRDQMNVIGGSNWANMRFV